MKTLCDFHHIWLQKVLWKFLFRCMGWFSLKVWEVLCDHDQKHPFFKFWSFCITKRCMHVHYLVLKKTTLIMWIFYKDDIQLQIQMLPCPNYYSPVSKKKLQNSYLPIKILGASDFIRSAAKVTKNEELTLKKKKKHLFS